jgi:hypothetical protein
MDSCPIILENNQVKLFIGVFQGTYLYLGGVLRVVPMASKENYPRYLTLHGWPLKRHLLLNF